MGTSIKLYIPPTKAENVIFCILKLCKSKAIKKQTYNDGRYKGYYLNYDDKIIKPILSTISCFMLNFKFYEDEIDISKSIFMDINHIKNGQPSILLSSNSNQLNAVLFYNLQKLFGGHLNYVDYKEDYTYKKVNNVLKYIGEGEGDEKFLTRKDFIDNLEPLNYNHFNNKRFPKEFEYSYENKDIVDKLKIFYEKDILNKTLHNTKNNEKKLTKL